MIYRFLVWLKSFLSHSTTCQLCHERTEYEDSAVIKVKHGNGAIFDMIICNNCADKLESHKIL
jgi:hypothetical protein